MKWPVEFIRLHTPPLEELAQVLQTALRENFEEAEVSVVTSPDLREEPFHLEGEGLCGSPRIADVGGVPYLFPIPKKDKIYDIKEVVRHIGLSNAFVVGSGAGPFPEVGVNCEFMANIVVGENFSNGCRIAKLDAAGNSELVKLPESVTYGTLLLNAFASEGSPGRVLRVRARKRTSEGGANLVTCLRRALEARYGDRPVALGGTFRVVEGSVRCHVMPDFSHVPIYNDAMINAWLHFFDMRAPMVFLSTLVSTDPGLDLRMEHSHGYGGYQGGHYHRDTTPDTIEYEAFYNVAEFLYRVDRPKVTHHYGRN